MPAYPTTKLDRIIDRKIVEQNKAITDTLCKRCIGRGFVYEPIRGDYANGSVVKPCRKCLESGKRMTREQRAVVQAVGGAIVRAFDDGELVVRDGKAGVTWVVLPSGMYYESKKDWKGRR